jgi:hypothetical protein
LWRVSGAWKTPHGYVILTPSFFRINFGKNLHLHQSDALTGGYGNPPYNGSKFCAQKE